MSLTQNAFTGSTGARPISALTRRIERQLADRLADAEDVDRNDLYRVLDGAKTALGLSASALETLKHLIGFTRPEDYRGNARPIAWPSNYTLAELAGVTESGIKARLRQLRKLALVTMRDSANGRRRGQRGDEGEIVNAYGIDLSPLRARFEELKTAAEAHTAFTRLDKRGRQELARVRRMVGQALAQAGELGLTGAHWLKLQNLVDEASAKAATARSVRDMTGMERVIASLPVIEDEVGSIIDRFMFPENDEASGSESRPPIHIQTIPHSKNVLGERGCNSDQRSRDARSRSTESEHPRQEFKTDPAELKSMFPTSAMYVAPSRPRWDDLHRGAGRLRHELGVRTGTWVEAIEHLGLDAAAIAMMITAERMARNQIRSTPGAYFSGMVARAKRGELDLAKSLWSFRVADGGL